MLSEEAIVSFDHNTLSIYFPLPFRIILLFILGFWLCAFNFHYFHIVGIDIGRLIRYTRHVPPEAPLYSDIYKVAGVLSALWGAGMVVFWKITQGSAELVESWEVVPLTVALGCVGVMIWPGNVWHRRGRGRFLRMLRRTLIGGLDTDLRFADILLADVITSYAKVLGDTYILICMSVVARGHAITARPDRQCGGSWGVPLVMAFPSLIRLRQCLTEYFRVRNKVPKKESHAHLWNAGKYASAFPVIFFSALQREWDAVGSQHWLTKEGIGKIWLLCVFIHSSYSFFWDVTKDWDLTLFTHLFSSSSSSSSSTTTSPDAPSHPWGLRPTRHYHANELYYGVIILDFLLRCTWSLKLSPHLGYVNDLEGGIFVLEFLELFRRFMWIFFRVEKEWCARTQVEGVGYRDDEEEVEEGLRLEEWRKEVGKEKEGENGDGVVMV
ncbi:EXS family-domain-containing protein [Kalaharituber pfeilii]|nr:EXS family-domain-containing protein [Kalaharituber pfeilii]